MKIETQEQADAAQELIAAVDKCLTHWPTSSLLTEHAQAALSEWNQRKEIAGITLSEDELVALKFDSLPSQRKGEVLMSLTMQGLLDIHLNATPAGRAYLDALPKRELRWEVHRVGVDKTFRLSTDNAQLAQELMEYLSKINCKQYEVREVAP